MGKEWTGKAAGYLCRKVLGTFLLRKIGSRLGSGREVLRTLVAPDGRAGGGMVARNGHAYAPNTRDLHSDSHIASPTDDAERHGEKGAIEDAELFAAEG